MSEITEYVIADKNNPCELFISMGDGEDTILQCHTPENAERFKRYFATEDDEEAQALLKNFEGTIHKGGDHD